MASELITTLREVLPAALYPGLGVSVTYTPVVGLAKTVSGIWDESEESRSQGEHTLSGRLWVLAADLPSGYGRNDVVTMDGGSYVVRNDPDDTRDGVGIWLHLRKKS